MIHLHVFLVLSYEALKSRSGYRYLLCISLPKKCLVTAFITVKSQNFFEQVHAFFVSEKEKELGLIYQEQFSAFSVHLSKWAVVCLCVNAGQQSKDFMLVGPPPAGIHFSYTMLLCLHVKINCALL